MAFPSTDNPNLVRFDESCLYHILIEISDHSKYWSTKAHTSMSGNDFSNSYTDEITKGGLGSIIRRINSFGGFSTVSDFDFDILNQENEADFLGAAVYYENDDIEVSIIFDDGTDLVYAERIKLFVGVVNSINFDENNLTIESVDISKKETKQVPSSTVDLATFGLADRNDIGRPIQIVFGEFDPDSETTGAPTNFNKTLRNNLTTAPTSGLIDISTRDYLLS